MELGAAPNLVKKLAFGTRWAAGSQEGPTCNGRWCAHVQVDSRPNNMVEGLIRIEDVAERLSLTKRGVESLVSRKVIPALKISRRCLRFRWTEVESAIERYRQREIQ